MTAVGFTTARESDYRVHVGVAKEKVKPLLAVSADSRDSVERIRRTPSDESASRNFADGVRKIRSHERSVQTDALWADWKTKVARYDYVSRFVVSRCSATLVAGFDRPEAVRKLIFIS
jgi:hypothetical protein